MNPSPLPSPFPTPQGRIGDIMLASLLILTSVSGVTLTFRQPGLCAALMAGVLALALTRWHQPLDWLTATTGLVLGPVLEFAAAASNLWHYPYASWAGLPAWVFTLWPAFPLVLLRLTHALCPPQPHLLGRRADLPIGLAIVALEIPVLVQLGTQKPLVTTLLTALMLATAAWMCRSPQTALMLLLSGVFGTLCESFPIRAGAWIYPNPLWAGMPAWLPTGYALFGFALVRIALGLHHRSLGLASVDLPPLRLARD